ncbi:hypothetical protein OGAPHI_004481 [Ogataea philodendri]|uniref:FAD synthase n=1 Tax=Ogataea philodendri TaxID=1378263 RepID=A0A9P8P6N7_9ASCO|nr:uncharacterized protein OGAPHI_004481 [Ogataea philodendri]KAH3666292.1 hypothetical protein OGAPHI_004481 [Ogataea philodendri]
MSSTTIEVCRQCHALVMDFLAMKGPYLANGNRKLSSPIPLFHNDTELHLKTQAQVANTLDVFHQMLEQYTLEEVSISYNGGKDCLVMLVVYLAAIYNKYQHRLSDLRQPIQSVYINDDQEFPEQDDFLDTSSAKYQLSLTRIKDNMKNGFRTYLDQYPKIKAIAVGVRKIDPYAQNLSYMQRTDHGWPSFMRVNPVLDWTYCEIWYFLKATDIQYCTLYDQGYTSIGGIENTIPNPLLKQGPVYLPAYMLDDDCHERLSRRGARDMSSREKRPDEKL